MVITAIFSALISGVKLAADPYDDLPAITFWLMGGLSYVVMSDVLMMLAPLCAGGVLLMLARFRLNVLSLSDEEISAIGIDAAWSRRWVILCATLLTSGSVAVGGMIGWVGLIVPHIARFATGPDYRRLLPASLLVGAIFLMIVDDLARTALGIELPPVLIANLWQEGKK
jgi:iron complex transport system permease protein